MIHQRLGVLVLVAISLISCSEGPQGADPTALEARATAHILAIPPARPDMYRGMVNMKGWQNPYLIIKVNGVALLDAGNHEEHLLKPAELTLALAKLPPSAWPYGRVVALTENGVRATGDEVPIRKNRALVAGTLESLRVLINWVPPA
jgi:hypothetical protein